MSWLDDWCSMGSLFRSPRVNWFRSSGPVAAESLRCFALLPVWTRPIRALDAFTRMRMQDEVLRLWQARRTTMLLVTHDIDEAIYMSDRIIIMTQRPGKIEQTIPIALERPRDRSSSDFLRLRGDILE